MRCNISQELIMKYFDRNINNIEEVQLKQHIQECEQCANEFYGMKEIISEIEDDSIQIEPPCDFTNQVMNRIENETVMYKRQYQDMSSVFSTVIISLSLVFVILMGGLFIELYNNSKIIIYLLQSCREGIIEFCTYSMSMAKGIGIAVKGIAAAVYTNYYYVYIFLGIVLLVMQSLFAMMIRESKEG